MKTKILTALVAVITFSATAQTNEDQWFAVFTNAVAQRDERIGMVAAMKGVEFGALIAYRLIEQNPEAYYEGTNVTAICDDAKLVAKRLLEAKEPFEKAMRGTKAAQPVTNDFVFANLITITNQITVSTNDVIKFVEAGGYCDAKGFHQWHYPPRFTTGNDPSLYRECLLCKKGQTQHPGEWK